MRCLLLLAYAPPRFLLLAYAPLLRIINGSDTAATTKATRSIPTNAMMAARPLVFAPTHWVIHDDQEGRQRDGQEERDERGGIAACHDGGC